MTTTYGLSTSIDRDFDVAIADVKAALADQGFGIITEIDMQATLKAKLDVDVEPQVILGACNPGFAHKALQAEPAVGLLLPCNVVVRRSEGRTIVEMINPQTMVDLTGSPAMAEIAGEVTDRLTAALTAVAG
jgi:uncharacterized protein (DUF302 family)